MTPDTTEGAEIAQKKESTLSFLIGENDTESNGNMEFDRFPREPVINSAEHSLEWWKRNQENFPSIAKFTRKYLCIPASSVPAERIFFTAGLVINQQRCSWLPENVDMLIFLNKNLPSTST